MSSLSSIVSVNISVRDSVPTQAGFGVPNILDFNTVSGNVPIITGTVDETFDFTSDTDLLVYVDDGPSTQTAVLGPSSTPALGAASTAADVALAINNATTGLTAAVIGAAVRISSDAGGNLVVGGPAADVLGLENPPSQRVSTYSSTQEMIDDGYLVTDAAVVAAGVMFSQSPRVPVVKVSRRTTIPSMDYDLTFKTSFGGNTVEVAVGGPLGSSTNSVSYEVLTTDTPSSVALAVEGLLTSLAIPNMTFSASGPVLNISTTTPGKTNTIYFRVSNSSGVALASEDNFSLSDNSADPGILSDYSAIKNEDNDFYGVILTSQSEAEYESLAGPAGVEGDVRLMVATSGASNNLSGGGLAQALEALNLNRTAVIYHTEPFEYLDCAWMGRMFTLDPGEGTWGLQANLASVSPDNLTSSQRSALEGVNANYYTAFAGLNLTQAGRSASGRYLDITRSIDWFTARLQERIVGVLGNVSKVPFTDSGAATIENQVRAQIQEAIAQGVFSSSPEPTVAVPLVATVSPANRANRILPDVSFTAQLAGAIQTIVINGTVTV